MTAAGVMTAAAGRTPIAPNHMVRRPACRLADRTERRARAGFRPVPFLGLDDSSFTWAFVQPTKMPFSANWPAAATIAPRPYHCWTGCAGKPMSVNRLLETLLLELLQTSIQELAHPAHSVCYPLLDSLPYILRRERLFRPSPPVRRLRGLPTELIHLAPQGSNLVQPLLLDVLERGNSSSRLSLISPIAYSLV